LVMPASSINAFPLREGGDHISATLEFLCAHCLPEGPEVRKPPQPKETRPNWKRPKWARVLPRTRAALEGTSTTEL